MLLPFERAKKAASEKQASRYELPAKDGGVISFGIDRSFGKFFQHWSKGELEPSVDEDHLKPHELVALMRDLGRPGPLLQKSIQALLVDEEPSTLGVRRMARFHEGPEGKKEFEAWMEDQPESFQDDWEEQNELHRDNFKEEALMEKTSAGGLYGHTKQTQREVETSVKNAKKHAAKLAKDLLKKDAASVDFLKAHSRRANSKTAKLLLEAMAEAVPKVASRRASWDSGLEVAPEGTDDFERAEEAAYARGVEDGAGGVNDRNPFKYGPYREAWDQGFDDVSRGRRRRASVNIAASEKIAGGMYGYPAKTARMVLSACTDLKAHVGELAFAMNSRRAAQYEQITGFLKEHGKTAKCAYSKMILDSYPERA